jgi:hypothetical protein
MRWLFLQAVADDPLERRGNGRAPSLRHRRGILAEHGAHRIGSASPAKGAPARDHFVERRAEAENVGAMIDRLAADLLRPTCSRPCPSRCPER